MNNDTKSFGHACKDKTQANGGCGLHSEKSPNPRRIPRFASNFGSAGEFLFSIQYDLFPPRR